VRPGGCWVRRVGTVTTDNGVSVHHPRLRRTTSMFGFFSPTRRLRAAFAKQLDQMAQKLNEAVRERDAARMTAKTLAEKLAAKRDEIVNVFNERAAAESKLANADSENARLHRELNAALCRCEELAGRADAADARAKEYAAGVRAAENVRDRAICDMNHVQELQKQAERDAAFIRLARDNAVEVANRLYAEVARLRARVNEWADEVLAGRTAGAAGAATAAATAAASQSNPPVLPVVGHGTTLTMMLSPPSPPPATKRAG
jgi:chromosome segregation ATPase